MRSLFFYKQMQVGKRIHEAISINAAHRLTMVVAVSHQHHRTTRRPRCLRIVARIPQHQRASRCNTQHFAGFEQWQRIGFFALKRITAKHHLKKPVQPFGLEQRQRKSRGLVGQ